MQPKSQDIKISIHAPRAGSDEVSKKGFNYFDISIHAPRAGSDAAAYQRGDQVLHFNPRSPCGERLVRELVFVNDVVISIHAPRAGSDVSFILTRHDPLGFQSTLPVRGATRCHMA